MFLNSLSFVDDPQYLAVNKCNPQLEKNGHLGRADYLFHFLECRQLSRA